MSLSRQKAVEMKRGNITDNLSFVGYAHKIFIEKKGGGLKKLVYRAQSEIPPQTDTAAVCVQDEKLLYVIPLDHAIQTKTSFSFRFRFPDNIDFYPAGQLTDLTYFSRLWSAGYPAEFSEYWHTFKEPLWIGKRKMRFYSDDPERYPKTKIFWEDQDIYLALRMDGKKIFSFEKGFIG